MQPFKTKYTTFLENPWVIRKSHQETISFEINENVQNVLFEDKIMQYSEIRVSVRLRQHVFVGKPV